MTQQAMETIRRLRAAMDGQVLTPSDSDFDDRRRVWNTLIDRHPSVIARCTSAGDVAAAIGFARRHDLVVAVRGGAHAPSGAAVWFAPASLEAAMSANCLIA